MRRFADERGFFTEIMRKDWQLLDDELAQANFSISYPGMVRAWHRHLRGQVDCFVVLNGALKICAYDDETEELDEIVTTDENLQVVRIPSYYWHGFKVIGGERDTRESPVSEMIKEFGVEVYGYVPLLSKEGIEGFGVNLYVSLYYEML